MFQQGVKKYEAVKNWGVDFEFGRVRLGFIYAEQKARLTSISR